MKKTFKIGGRKVDFVFEDKPVKAPAKDQGTIKGGRTPRRPNPRK